MANGIFRKVTLGIAKETSYGTAAGAPTFSIANVELSMEEVVNYVENNAMLGSTYEVNDARVATREVNFSMTMKVDENSLPLFFLQKFGIVSAAAAGETVVYDHTLTYLNTNTGTSFTLFWDDPDRTDKVIAGAHFESINFTMEPGGFLTAEVTGKGIYPTDTAVALTVTEPNEFVGRNVNYQIADEGGVLAAQGVLTMNANHSFPLSGDDNNFELGNLDKNNQFTLADRFELEITALYPDSTFLDNWRDGQAKESEIDIIDTDRFVVGSVASTRPEIKITYPSQSIIAWSREGGPDDLLTQNMTLLAQDKIGVTDAPVTMVITNAVASY